MITETEHNGRRIRRFKKGDRRTALSASRINELVDSLNPLNNIRITNGDSNRVFYGDDSVLLQIQGGGATGPAGPTGPTGPTGPAGSNGPGLGFVSGTSGTSGEIDTIIVDASDNIYAMGQFQFAGGFYRSGIAMFNQNLNVLRPMWSLAQFIPFSGSTLPGTVNDASLTTDGRLWIVGDVTIVHGQPWTQLSLCSASDGSPDGSFAMTTGFQESDGFLHSCANYSSDNSVFVVNSTKYNGTTTHGLVRIDTSGAIVTLADIGSGGNATAIRPYGGDFILGGISSYNGASITNYVARVTATGLFNSTFNGNGTGTAGSIAPSAILVHSTQLYVAGASSGTSLGIVRLNSDGTEDTSFTCPGPGANTIFCCDAVSGVVYIGGNFATIGGTARSGFARLHSSDGSLDTGFTCNLNSGGELFALKILFNGNIVVGGNFTTINGVTRANIALVDSTGTVL